MFVHKIDNAYCFNTEWGLKLLKSCYLLSQVSGIKTKVVIIGPVLMDVLDYIYQDPN